MAVVRLAIGPIPEVVLAAGAVLAWVRPPLTRAAHRALVGG